MASGQAELCCFAGRPSTTRMCRNVFQLGVHQAPAPRLLSQPLYLRAAWRGDRVHGFRSTVVPQLLPGDRWLEERSAKNHHRLRIGVSVGRRRARYPARRARSDRRPPRRRRIQTTVAYRARLSAANSFESVLSQQRRVHRRPRGQRHSHHAGGGADSAQLRAERCTSTPRFSPPI